MKNTLANVIDKLKVFTLDSLVEQAIYHISERGPLQQPWILLSFLEIVYRECDNNSLKFKADYRDFYNICQHLFKLMDLHPLSDFTNNHPKKIFHVLAYQQFPYQVIFDKKHIQRQSFLFNAENPNSKLNIKLLNEYEFSVSEFLKFLESLINKTEFSFSEKTAEKLLKKLTIKHQDISNKIHTYSNGIGNDFYKTFVADFFIKYPFIEFNKQLYCIDSKLLIRTMCEFLFERVLDWNETKKNFDDRFQEYVYSTLQKNGINYKDDKSLKLQGQEECDLLVEDFLFAECKAIKMKPLVQVNPSDQILNNNLDHIIKAYKQILSTANRNKRSEYFGAIITFLPFYFSDCTDIWDLIKEDIRKYLEDNNLDLLIEPSHLFFIDIKSWDMLIDYIVTNPNETLKSIFQGAYETNANSPKFEFTMHFGK